MTNSKKSCVLYRISIVSYITHVYHLISFIDVILFSSMDGRSQSVSSKLLMCVKRKLISDINAPFSHYIHIIAFWNAKALKFSKKDKTKFNSISNKNGLNDITESTFDEIISFSCAEAIIFSNC